MREDADLDHAGTHQRVLFDALIGCVHHAMHFVFVVIVFQARVHELLVIGIQQRPRLREICQP